MLFPNYNEIKAAVHVRFSDFHNNQDDDDVDDDDDDDDDDNVELLHFRKADAMKQELLAIMWDAFNIGALVDEDFDDKDPLLAEVQVFEEVDN